VALSAVFQFDGREIHFGMGFGDLIGLVIMAAIAGVFCIAARMAGFAADVSLAPVIERELVCPQVSGEPGLGGMASPACQAEETCVDLWLGMAPRAVAGRAGKGVIGVAIQAFEFRMPAIQQEDIGVIEGLHAIDPIVAVQASLAHLIAMLLHKAGIVFTMTADAGFGREALNFGWVASEAGKIFAGEILRMASQAKYGILFMFKRLSVQVGRSPTTGGMALAAIVMKSVRMKSGLRMAGNAIWRNLKKGPAGLNGRLRPGVALEAICTGMLTVQGKRCSGVIETRHAVGPIVTIQAVIPGFPDVLFHKIGLVGAVAGDAIHCGGFQPMRPGRVAAPASHGRGAIIHLVPDQVEARQAVIEARQGPGVQRIVPAVVFRMAACAILHSGDLAVEPFPAIDFHGYA
jgi:hypothetical protein